VRWIGSGTPHGVTCLKLSSPIADDTVPSHILYSSTREPHRYRVMTTSPPLKQSLFKKAFIEPFRIDKLKRKSSAPSGLFPITKSDDPLEALPLVQYGSLDRSKKSIRLLEILPGHDFEPISTKLCICDLDETPSPSYIALSYRWHQGSVQKYVECQGTKMRVGANLWNFLHQYRKRFFMRQYGEQESVQIPRLWVDSACINQEDLEERSHQVSLMRDIYMGAESVIAWLGLAQSSEELAFLLTRYPNLLHVEEMATELIALLSKSYWNRVWVVQEFMLARIVEIWCGKYSADAASFESIWKEQSAVVGLGQLPQRIASSPGGRLFKYRRDFNHKKKVKREVMGRRNSKTVRTTLRLRDLLQDFASSQSSEVYDKIYGFLGIASNGRGDKIRPDYSKAPVELLVDVLRNQCHDNPRQGDKDDYQFLTFLMRALNVSRMELAQYIIQQCPNVQPHIYVLAATPCVVASVSFISTISDTGIFVDHEEAFQQSTWRSKWSRSNMHPATFSTQDILDLGDHVTNPDTELLLSFADPHVPHGNPGPSQKLRQAMIEKSADLVIDGLIQSEVGKVPITALGADGGKKVIHDIFSRSMTTDAADFYTAARTKLARRNTDHRDERYTSFVGTNGITGLACGGGPGSYEIAAGDRICVFSGMTESNNAFIMRLEGGKWLISGLAIILLPELRTPAVQRTGSGMTMTSIMTMATIGTGALSRQRPLINDTTMCFHCHLSDLLELQRCRLLNEIQMKRLLEQTLRSESESKTHRCIQGTGENDILEFGL
jgi:hypothetical protein